MINEFSRTEMLIGAGGANTLKGSTVAVFEVGGVGSHAVGALARCGVGRLVPVGNDTASPTSINQQNIALHSTIGQFKTRVMKEKIADICPDTQVITFEELILPDSIESLFEHMELQVGQGNSVGYILNAIDTVTAKLALAGSAASYGIPAIVSVDTGNRLHPGLLRISDILWTSVYPLCKVTRKELKAGNISGLRVYWSPEQPLTPGQAAEDTRCRRATPGSISFVPPMAGLVIVGAIIRNIYGLG